MVCPSGEIASDATMARPQISGGGRVPSDTATCTSGPRSSATTPRLPSSEVAAASTPRIVRVGVEGQHPTLCRDGAEGHRCERVSELSFMPAGDVGVTALLGPRARGWR